MSKSRKHGKKLATKDFGVGDVTINDFANSSVTNSRPKKSTNNVTHVLKQLEEKTWDEKLDEFEGDFDFVQEENEDGTVSYIIRKVEPRRRRKTTSSSDEKTNTEGNGYPLDIWFLISEFIRPEDVGRFAGICKSSLAVVCTAKFWFSMYRRYYKTVPNLPERLQPECMFRLYGLRTSVVRALYHMYAPFVERIKGIKPIMFEEHPDILKRRQCVLMWYKKQKKQWLYYFKLRERTDLTLPHCRTFENKPNPDLIEMLGDVSANPDENCRILQVACRYFVAVPIVTGLTLNSVTLTLSQGLMNRRLQLGFGSGINIGKCGHSSADASTTAVVILDPVITVKVLDWWHPLYPHNNMQFLLNRE